MAVLRVIGVIAFRRSATPGSRCFHAAIIGVSVVPGADRVDADAPIAVVVCGTTATFGFTSNEAGSTFLRKFDTAAFTTCTSPKTYKSLKRGKHVFHVKARDRAGNTDATPALKTFRIKA